MIYFVATIMILKSFGFDPINYATEYIGAVANVGVDHESDLPSVYEALKVLGEVLYESNDDVWTHL